MPGFYAKTFCDCIIDKSIYQWKSDGLTVKFW